MADQHRFETKAIRGQMDRTQYREHSMPMFLSSSFVFPSAEEMRDTFAGETEGIIYSRYSNPNTDELIGKVCAMEGTEDGFATASGMAAVYASMAAFLEQGDHVLASRAVFGSTHQILTQILPKWGITHTYVDPTDIDQWEKHIRPNTRMLVLESPSNPGLALVDLEKAGALARKYNLLFNIDNCFATPYLQKPAQYGADLIVSGVVSYGRNDVSGFQEVDVVSQRTGQKIRQTQFVEQEEFSYDLELIFIDGPTGTLRFRDRIRRVVVFRGLMNDPIHAFYELSESISADVLAVVSTRMRAEPRTIFRR